MSVTITNLTVDFGGLRVLDRFTATINDGVLTALTGPSGSGKTTLLGVIGGIIPANSGSIHIDFREANPALAVWVPQGANALSARNLIDNVRIAALSDGVDFDTAGKIAEDQLQRVGLGARTDSLARELSGGELQRLALARALASSRPLLLADEPTANLDQETAFGIIDLLRSIRVQRTMIIATHDADLVAAADEVIDLRAHTLQSRTTIRNSNGAEG